MSHIDSVTVGINGTLLIVAVSQTKSAIWNGRKMYNNDVLIRLRYALDIKDVEMVEIFKFGGVNVTTEEVLKMLVKVDKDDEDNEDRFRCNNVMLESFLNGLIIFKRGEKDTDKEKNAKPILTIKNSGNVNNVILKKLKIALSFSSEDMLEILELAGCSVSKGELSAVFRKEGHRNYKVCEDSYTRNFLKGLAIQYRK